MRGFSKDERRAGLPKFLHGIPDHMIGANRGTEYQDGYNIQWIVYGPGENRPIVKTKTVRYFYPKRPQP